MSEINVQNTNIEQLDPINPNVTSLNCSGNQLETLPDLPDGLLVLICRNNPLEELPDLPPGLRILDCSVSPLEKLPDLPDGLLELNCNENPIDELPPLPISIQSLDCSYTHIRGTIHLPLTLVNLRHLVCVFCDLVSIPVLPPNITEFNCSNNPIDTLSEPLPQGLLMLMCSNCYLDNLPELPNSLLDVECNHNSIRELPELPPVLRTLLCVGNSIERLPALPASLIVLDCNHNELGELPDLPHGLETLECAGNHIRNLPALPASLTKFDITRNPINNESFAMLTQRFPQFTRDDFTEEPEPEEPVPEEPEEPEPEITEGDLIEERNIAIQYEVHDAFNKINLSKLIPIIDSETPPYDPDRLFDALRQFVYGNTLESEEKGRIIALFEQSREKINDTLHTCISDAPTQHLISAALAYVGRQNPEFQNNYILFLIDDISSAYEFNPEIPDLDTGSCPKGIIERIIMNLKSATLGQTEEYKLLINAFENIPIDFMREFTSACIEKEKARIAAASSPEEKASIVADCVREKLQLASWIPPRGAEEVPDPPEFVEYAATLKYGFEGGTRRKKKTRKLKKKKTKRKIKKLKHSKNNRIK